MRKKHLFLTITAVFMLFAMVLSLAACGGGGGSSSGGGEGGGGGTTAKEYTTKDIKALKDLTNYSKLTADYKPTKTYSYDASAKKYDGKDCSEQWDKLQTRIDDKTEDVLNGDTDSAVTKIFTKSTPDGILGAIANADLTFDEMVRVVNYIAGEEKADVNAYVKDEGNSWSGLLTTTSSSLKSWTELSNDDGKDLNTGWSFFDDWELNDRLKEYAKSDYSGLSEGRGIKKSSNKNAFGTKDTANDNASWQYRSILEKIYKPASEGGVDLPGNAASRLATYMLEYATEVAEGMANDTIENAANNGNASAFSTYFRNNLVEGDPYAALADYDVLVYLLSFHDLYEVKPYSGLDGLRSCVQLYGFYYQYNQTYYNIVLKDRARYTNQLKYEKLEVFTDTEWLDYVKIQRENYVGSYRYSADFYFTFYSVHFDFQGRKEDNEKTVYVISDSVNGRSYTVEMKQAINKANKGLEGQLAMSDWTWCYGGSESNMKSYNKANTDYQEGKNSGDKEKEYKGLFYYEVEELKVVDYLLTKMSTTELSGALYYNCYAYSGSMINEMQNYAKDIVLINDQIKGYDKFTSIPAAANINVSDYDTYAMGKLATLKAQAKEDWSGADVDNKAMEAKNQPWSTIAKEIKEAQKWSSTDAMDIEAESTGEYTNVWRKRCDYLEDRVVAKKWSCCDQRVSEADLKKCSSGHSVNKDNSPATKEYDASQSTSQFASKYETILMYVATKAEVSFQTPEKGYHGSDVAAKTYTPGYYGNIEEIIEGCNSGSDGEVIKYRENNTMTMAIGASFEKEVVNEDGDDHDWWETNRVASPLNKFDPETYSETDISMQKSDYTYTYTFKGWYLDQECKYVFNPADDIDFNIKLYAGYEIVKAK